MAAVPRAALSMPYRLVALAEINATTTTATTAGALDPVEPEDAVIFVGLSLVPGITCRHLLRRTRVPYTVALLVVGIGLGSLEYGMRHGLGKLGAGIRLWAEINPNLLLSVFLLALLFESSFSMEIHQIKILHYGFLKTLNVIGNPNLKRDKKFPCMWTNKGVN